MKKLFNHYSRIIVTAIIEEVEDVAKQRREFWVKKWLLRESHGGSAGRLRELAVEDYAE